MALLDLVRPRVTELGKIKIGGKDEKVRQSKGGGTWRAPKKLDHFLITGMARTEAGDLVQDIELMDRLAQKHADADGKLRKLPIILCSNDIEDIMQARYVWYGGKRVAGRSDGKTVVWYGNPKTMKFRNEGPIEEPWKDEYLDLAGPNGSKLFKLHSVFNCMIASDVARWGGLYKFRTTSRITASQLLGSMMHIHQLTGGVLRGLPMQLVIRPMMVEPDGKPTKVFVVHCELTGADLLAIRGCALELAKSEAENSRQLRTAQIEYRRLLSAPGEDETYEESTDVAEEFHPETIDQEGVDQPAPEEESQVGLDDFLGQENGSPDQKEAAADV